MKKGVILKVISIVFTLMTILAIACALSQKLDQFHFDQTRKLLERKNKESESEKKVIADKAASKETII